MHLNLISILYGILAAHAATARPMVNGGAAGAGWESNERIGDGSASGVGGGSASGVGDGSASGVGGGSASGVGDGSASGAGQASSIPPQASGSVALSSPSVLQTPRRHATANGQQRVPPHPGTPSPNEIVVYRTPPHQLVRTPGSVPQAPNPYARGDGILHNNLNGTPTPPRYMGSQGVARGDRSNAAVARSHRGGRGGSHHSTRDAQLGIPSPPSHQAAAPALNLAPLLREAAVGNAMDHFGMPPIQATNTSPTSVMVLHDGTGARQPRRPFIGVRPLNLRSPPQIRRQREESERVVMAEGLEDEDVEEGRENGSNDQAE